MKRTATRAFTIIELLVVVSIIALLIGMLVPAITQARDQAKVTASLSNLRNLGAAHANYASEWSDRQFTLSVDNIASYGSDPAVAIEAYAQAHATDDPPACGDYPPPILLGWSNIDGGCQPGNKRMWAWFFCPQNNSTGSNNPLMSPIIFDPASTTFGFGWFRLPNAGQFTQYLTGRFYDPVFYAPKDAVVMDVFSRTLDDPNDYMPTGPLPALSDNVFCLGSRCWSSYSLSPAALLNPIVMRNTDAGGWRDPWSVPAGFKTPAMSQAQYPDLKTHMLEQHWLQGRRVECNPAFPDGSYDGCEPYYFNHGWESVPMTLFYDGHVQGLGVREAEAADGRHETQAGYGLWSRDTSFGPGPDGGYFMDLGYDFSETSFHILTTDGIRGRDTVR